MVQSTEPTVNADPPQSLAETMTIAGESRVNLIRILAIAVFYLQHCINFFFLNADGALTERFHTQVTLLVAAWGSAAALIYHVLRRRCLPSSFSLLTLLVDLVLAFLLVNVAGGPQSSLVLLLPIIVFSSALRQELSLVRIAVVGALLTYGTLLVTFVWLQTGSQKYYAEESLRISRSEQLIVAAAILVSGLLAGQVIRQRHFLMSRQVSPVSTTGAINGETSHG